MNFELDKDLTDALVGAGLEILWNPGQVHISSDFMFEPPCSIKWARIGPKVSLGAYSYAVSGHFQSVTIGRYTSIGEEVQTGRGNHNPHSVSNSPIFDFKEQLFALGPSWQSNRAHADRVSNKYELPTTQIGHDVWIGHGAFIKPGIEIGNGAIVGAHAVVTKNVKPYSVVAGNPAKLIRMRFDEETIGKLLDSEWWNLNLEQLEGIKFDDPGQVVERVRKLKELRQATPSAFHFRRVQEFVSIDLNSNSHNPTKTPRIVAQPFRHNADLAFSRGDVNEAVTQYLASVQCRESGLLYSLVNGCLAALASGDVRLAQKWFEMANARRNEDASFFENNGTVALKNLLDCLSLDDTIRYLTTLGVNPEAGRKANLEHLVLGFPRCGTTSFTSALQRIFSAQLGLVYENFPRLTGLEVKASTEKLLVEKLERYDLYLRIGVLVRTRPTVPSTIIDKSTSLCCSKELMASVITKYPKVHLYITQRDPFERSISAYQKCGPKLQLSLADSIHLEVDAIDDCGGIRKIFSHLENYVRYLEVLLGSGIDYPIVYPSVLMTSRDRYFPASIKRRVMATNFIASAKTSLGFGTAPQREPHLNQGPGLHRPLTENDLEALERALSKFN